MVPGDYPVPPIALFWDRHHHSSANGLDIQYATRISLFNRLHNLDAPRRAAAATANKRSSV